MLTVLFFKLFFRYKHFFFFKLGWGNCRSGNARRKYIQEQLQNQYLVEIGKPLKMTDPPFPGPSPIGGSSHVVLWPRPQLPEARARRR